MCKKYHYLWTAIYTIRIIQLLTLVEWPKLKSNSEPSNITPCLSLIATSQGFTWREFRIRHT